MGDFNSKSPAWNCTTTDDNGKTLRDYIIKHDLSILAPNISTHIHRIPSRNKCIIDFGIATNLHCFSQTFVRQVLNSDHYPVITQFTNLDISRLDINHKITDWDIYTENLSGYLKNFPRPNSTDSIDHAIAQLTNKIHNCAEESSHITTPPPGFHTLPKGIKALLNQRNRARRQYQLSYSPIDRLTYTNLKKEASRRINKFRKTTWENFTSSLIPGSPSYWRLVRTFKKPKTNIQPLRIGPNPDDYAYSKEEKANTIASHLQKQFTDNPPFRDIEFQPFIDRKTEIIYKEMEDHLKDDANYCSPREIRNIVTKFKSKITPGYDKISNKMIKNLPMIGYVILANIFNCCLRFGYFPDCWKKAIISPIMKPGKDPSLAASYRPISLLPSMSKLFEHIINARMKKFHLEHPFIPDIQHGFRPKLSTNHQLIRVQETILQGFNKGHYTTGVFLDVAQAFDRVWHQGLIYKIHKLKLPHYLFRILVNYILERTFQVTVDGTLSKVHTMQAGVAQGSVLAPVLFSIYLSDMPILPNCTTALYADDTAILCTAKNVGKSLTTIRHALRLLDIYYQMWKIKINPSKSNAIVFRPNRKKVSKPRSFIKINKETIPWSTSIKYLGIIMDDKLNFKEHIITKAAKAISLFFSLKPLLGARSKLSMKAKLLIYKSIIRTMTTYGCPMWAHLPEISYIKIQVAQNKILRWISRARWFQRNWLIHKDLQMPTIHEYITKTSRKFFKNNANHKNSAYAMATAYDWSLPAKFPSPRIILANGPRPP